MTNNGKLVGESGTYNSPDEAIQGGLEALRKALGW
jgi:hypothetical protein